MTELTLTTGLRAIAAKNYTAMHAACISAIKADVKNPRAYFLLGVIALEHQNYPKALELLGRAETLDKREPYYPAYLAMTLSTLRRARPARAAADRAAKLKGASAHLRDMLGVVYSRCGFHKDAIVHFKAATRANPNAANYFFNLAASLQFFGQFERADAAYRKTLEIDPNNYRSWSSLVSLKKQTPDDNALKTLTELSNSPGLDADAKLHLGHAMAKTLEDLGRHEDSFDALLEAKKEKRAQYPFDRDAAALLFKAAKNTVNVQAPVADFAQDVTPVFIVGLPRTGTTLVDRILSSHSRVTSAGELNAFAEQVKNMAGTASPYVLDAETLQAAGNTDLGAAGQAYLEATQSLAGGSEFMVDKMPLNFFYAALMIKAFPKAKIIALRRGAMDSCLSNFRQLFSTQFSYYNYTFDLDDTAFFYRQFDALMAHFRAHLPADRFTEIGYEDIVFDQENQTRRLLAFCGLDWEEACMRFHENTAAVSTASSVQVRQKLYSGSVGRWKKYGDKLAGLNAALGDIDA